MSTIITSLIPQTNDLRDRQVRPLDAAVLNMAGRYFIRSKKSGSPIKAFGDDTLLRKIHANIFGDAETLQDVEKIMNHWIIADALVVVKREGDTQGVGIGQCAEKKNEKGMESVPVVTIPGRVIAEQITAQRFMPILSCVISGFTEAVGIPIRGNHL